MVKRPVQLGLRENFSQFLLLAVVNAFGGAMIGVERSILPAMAEEEFLIAARSARISSGKWPTARTHLGPNGS